MSLTVTLLLLPLLPLVAALWLALSRGRGWPGLFPLVSLAPIAAAFLVADARTGVPYFLTTNLTVFELDASSRPPLLLFGALWLVAGLLYRRRDDDRSAVPQLVALSGAMTVALANQGAAVLCGMLVAGFGLCAVIADESGTPSRRPVRILAALLIASYLLIFEALLHAGRESPVSLTAASAGMIVPAVALLAGIPPAHVWQSAALRRASTPTSLLLVAAPAGIALTGGLTLLSGAGSELAPACLVLAMAGAAWSAWAGSRQRSATGALISAAAATASLLLLGLVAAAPAAVAWLALSLLASTGALVVIRVQPPGFVRSACLIATVLFHGIAAGQLALHAGETSPAFGAIPPSAVAAVATMLVTMTACRIAAGPVPRVMSPGGAVFSLLLIPLSAAGLVVAWTSGANTPAAALPALAGIGLGLLLPRMLPARQRPGLSAGSPPGRAAAGVTAAIRTLNVFCERRLPHWRDRLKRRLAALWQGETWTARIASVEALLARWPTTALGVLFVAIVIGLLLLA